MIATQALQASFDLGFDSLQSGNQVVYNRGDFVEDSAYFTSELIHAFGVLIRASSVKIHPVRVIGHPICKGFRTGRQLSGA